jgi:hypothetical protein
MMLFQPLRYATGDNDVTSLYGKIALLNKGLHFCREQVNKALSKFSGVHNMSLEGVDDVTDDEVPEYDEEDDNSDSNDDGDDDDVDDDSHTSVLTTMSNQIVQAKPRYVTNMVWVWIFPEHVSQSTLEGRNGSSACSVIALLFAHRLRACNLDILPSPTLPSEWANLMVISIKEGNELYDCSRSSLPQRYLSVAEAAIVLGDRIDVTISQPLPVRVCDDHEHSTLKYNLCQLCTSSATSCAIFIVNEMAVLFIGMGIDSLILIDSHRHGQGGAAIILGKIDYVEEFIVACKDILSLNDTTYGNFVNITI